MLNDWVTLFLALLLVPVLVIEEQSVDPVAHSLAAWANGLIWLAFALDYAIDLWRSRDRRMHLRSHWADLMLIVVSPPLLVPPEAQALRVLRALRAFRALAVIGVVAERVDRPLGRGAILGILAVLGAVIVVGGLAIRAAEPTAFPNVAQGYAWAIANVVTAGHASPEPTSAAGHAIATTIAVMGLGTFAALAASVGRSTG